MSDAFHDAAGSIDTLPTKEEILSRARMRAKEVFLNCLYRYLSESKGNSDEYRRVCAAAEKYEKLVACGDFYDRTGRNIPFLLIEGSEKLWADLLLHIGKEHHLFPQFKDISPFSDKSLVFYEFVGTKNPSQAPRVAFSSLWERKPESADDHPDTMVVVGPRKAEMSVYLFK